MEHLEFTFPGRRAATGRKHAVLVGVVGSGNLEVLLEPKPLGGACQIVVKTAVAGFGEIWQAVLEDFCRRHGLGDLLVSINDLGATPAVVALRLDQAVHELEGSGP
ncbi:MAG: malonate decarboxylase acyl carrier protein [Luteitalea sp.]|nr:malonate decarboxylase acyl carrier protein [Luteitalea sp.]